MQGRIAIVTGASRGIGRSIAKALAREGARVAINYRTSEKDAASLAQEIQSQGGETLLVKADVSKSGQVKSMVQKTIERFGRIDILVNNAGIIMRMVFLDTPEDMWDKVLEANLKSVFLCSKEVAPIMLNQKKGKIINISSTAGLGEKISLGDPSYAVSKAGIFGLTRSLAVNLGPQINVNAICAGTIANTGMVSTATPEITQKKIDESLLKRIGTPEDIANAVVFLASDEADFITGEILTVAGGRAMR